MAIGVQNSEIETEKSCVSFWRTVTATSCFTPSAFLIVLEWCSIQLVFSSRSSGTPRQAAVTFSIRIESN